MTEVAAAAVLVPAALLAWAVHCEWDALRMFLQSRRGRHAIEGMLDLGVDDAAYAVNTAALSLAGAAVGILFLKNWTAAVLLAVVAYLYRKKSLEIMQLERKALIDSQAEVALQMVASLYETMGDMVQAMAGTAECVPSPMRDELKRVVAEYNAGKPLHQAMLGMAERSGSRDIDVFVRGVLLSEKYGTNTSEVVQNVAQLVRDRITLREELTNELRGQKLTVDIFLMLIPVAGAALYIFSPEARTTMTGTVGGKAIVCMLICAEYAAWHLTRGQRVVDRL